MNRRRFIGAAALSGVAALSAAAETPRPAPLAERLCLFTDHLDDYDYGYPEVARMLKQLGIAGPDLTVRPGGLVRPERVPEDLPRAAAAFREQGLSIPMISTALTSAADPTARPLLETAGKLGVRFFKLGYYSLDDPARWKERLEAARKELGPLLRLSRAAGLRAGLHNHAGASIGGALWDGWEFLAPLDPAAVGFYYDPAQATIEGGNHGWKLGFHRLAERLNMVAIKDFVWEKSGDGWRTRWVPLGQGMVRWPEFFAMLAKVSFPGPISLHIEYDPGGGTKAQRFENSFLAAERDLKFLREQLRRVS